MTNGTTCQPECARTKFYSTMIDQTKLELSHDPGLTTYIVRAYNESLSTQNKPGFFSRASVHPNIRSLTAYQNWRLSKMALIKVALTSPKHPVFVKDTHLDTVNIIGYAGGILGMFTGFSFLDVTFTTISALISKRRQKIDPA